MRPVGQRSDVSEFRRRFRWHVLVVMLAYLILIGRLAQLQIVEGEIHAAQALRNIVRQRGIPTSRGVIRDAQGQVIAGNRASFNVYVTPQRLDMEKTWPQLVTLMKLEPLEEESLRNKVTKLRESGRAEQQIPLKVDVSREVLASLETFKAQLTGVEVVPAPVRYYPFGQLGAHVVGYMREVDGDALLRLRGRGYRAGDRLGAVGVERRWESYLRGQRGWMKALWSYRGTVRTGAEDVIDGPTRQEPIPGRDITLTLDMDLQKSISRAMRAHVAGAVAVIDVRNGRILGAYSKPSFDPNLISGGATRDAMGAEFRRLFADPLNPMLDRVVSASYPPGSTFKPFSALTGLRDGIIDPTMRIRCSGGYWYGRRYFRCTGVHGNVNLHEAITASCNSYFYALGDALQGVSDGDPGIDRLAAMGSAFGMGERTGIGTNPESPGRMPTRSWYTRRYKGAFHGGFTLLSAIGQGATTVTILQLTLAYAALANGGILYQPQVVRSIETSDGTIQQDFPPRVRRMVELNMQQLDWVKAAMRDVVAGDKGTAHAARIEGIDVAGKTGTAQVTHKKGLGGEIDKAWYYNRDHAWFAGWAPASAPEIAIVVLVEHGGGGGKVAAPVAMEVIRDWRDIQAKRTGDGKGASE